MMNHFSPYPDVIKIIFWKTGEIILQSSEVGEYYYSLTVYLNRGGSNIQYEYYYHPWGCSPCGGSSPCEECGACLEGRPHLPVPEFFEKLRNWLENEKRNRGLPLIEIRGNP